MKKSMKVILKQSVPGLGAEGEVKTVRMGYARNFLLPRSLVMAATEGAIRDAEKRIELKTRKEETRRTELQKSLSKLADVEITMQATASEDGTLFAGIHAADLLPQLTQSGISGITTDMIRTETIKKIGDHAFQIVVDADHVTRGTLHVVSLV